MTLILLHFRENNCSELKKETAIKVETLTTDHKEKVSYKFFTDPCNILHTIMTKSQALI